MDEGEFFILDDGSLGSYQDSFLESELVASSRATAPVGVKDGQEEDDEDISGAWLDPGRQACDFLSAITSISKIYAKGDYAPMRPLNDVKWEPIAGGRDFEVSTSMAENRVICKKLRNSRQGTALAPEDLALIVRELCILDHLRGHENIVRLLGIGWFCDHVEDDLELTPCPKPGILLEAAEDTLEGLLDKLRLSPMAFRTETKICRDVSLGLQALHDCGIVHGDIKPANVLVFPLETYENGAVETYYQCKISDFSMARQTTGRKKKCWFEWGTRGYMAPERRSELTPAQLMLTDIWSLGILFAIVTDRQLNLDREGNDPAGLGMRIRQRVNAAIEQSTWDVSMIAVRQCMFENTLQMVPNSRSLRQVVFALSTYLDSSLGEHRYIPNPTLFPGQHDVFISYESFKKVSGPVKDALVSALQNAARNTGSLRQSSAFFELAVIKISGYVCPYDSHREGLRCLQTAAALGDVRARALFSRVSQALGYPENTTVEEFSEGEVLSWLEFAAGMGHLVAFDELSIISPIRANRAQCSLVRRLFGMNKNQSSPNEHSTLSSACFDGATIHAMAASGDLNNIRKMAFLATADINARDIDGNTPLMLATRYGHYRVIDKLVDLGANAGLVNEAGENLLHYASNLTEAEFTGLLAKLSGQPSVHGHLHELIKKEALGRPMSLLVFPFSLPAGTPLERAIAMNKPYIVSVLLKKISGHVISNGRLIRRALLLAFRLLLPDIQIMLLSFVESEKHHQNVDLPHLELTRWEYRGSPRTYLDAIAVGAISGLRESSVAGDVPIQWWRICHLGSHWDGAFRGSIDQIWRLIQDRENKPELMENLVDRSIHLCLQERISDVLSILLDIKANVTMGEASRPDSLRSLVWDSFSIPRSRMEPQYHQWDMPEIIISSPGRLLSILKENIFGKPQPQHHVAISEWGPMLYNRHSSGTVDMNPITIAYVDQIFWSTTDGTLLQQAIQDGDRHTFSILVDRFGANLFLPACSSNATLEMQYWEKDEKWHLQINVYALLAHSAHCDLWFAKKIYSRGVPFSWPAQFSFDTDRKFDVYLPPLSHALYRRRWGYALWLCRHGAQLDEVTTFGRTGECWTVLSTSLFLGRLDRELLHFFFPMGCTGRGYEHLPTCLRSNHDGYPVFRFVHDIYRKMFDIDPIPVDLVVHLSGKRLKAVSHEFTSPGNSHSVSVEDTFQASEAGWRRLAAPVESLCSCWQHLLDVYPDVPNQPSAWWLVQLPFFRYLQLKFPYKPKSLLEQALSMGHGSSILFDMTLEHFESLNKPFPHQDWLDLLFGSPLNRLSVQSWLYTPLCYRHGYWPSLQNPAFIIFWALPLANYLLMQACLSMITLHSKVYTPLTYLTSLGFDDHPLILFSRIYWWLIVNVFLLILLPSTPILGIFIAWGCVMLRATLSLGQRISPRLLSFISVEKRAFQIVESTMVLIVFLAFFVACGFGMYYSVMDFLRSLSNNW